MAFGGSGLLDVLKSYTPVNSYYKLVKTVESDPEFDVNKAQKKLRRYVESHDTAIRLKAEAAMGQLTPIPVDAIVGSLPISQQQLVEIAKAIGARARILILDEPTASLTDREVERLFRVIGTLRDAQALASRTADEVTTIAIRLAAGTTPAQAERELAATFPGLTAISDPS